MSRRDAWQEVLDGETSRWSKMSWGQLVEEVSGVRVCEVVREGKRYQAEVQLLENKDAYIHVAITVDDGSLPASIIPATHTFIRQKQAV